jgi:hypothetical protein
MRPMAGFAEQSNLASVFATLDCIVASAPRDHRWRGAADRGTHPGARVRSNAALLFRFATLRRTLPGCVFSAEYFPLLRGNMRFQESASATQVPSKNPVLPHAIYLRGRRAASSPHAGRKTARFSASRLSA